MTVGRTMTAGVLAGLTVCGAAMHSEVSAQGPATTPVGRHRIGPPVRRPIARPRPLPMKERTTP